MCRVDCGPTVVLEDSVRALPKDPLAAKLDASAVVNYSRSTGIAGK